MSMLQARRRGSRVTLLSLCSLSFVGLLACKSETSVDAFVDNSARDVCEAVVQCACEYPNGATYEHCLGQLTVNLDSAAQLNIVAGLSFDGDCADRAAAVIKDIACGVALGEPDAECEAPCKVWHGPVGKGATCTTVNGSDNCEQGLACGGDGVCIDPCAEPKVPKIGEVCGGLLGCEEGAYCELDSLTPICQPLPVAGQPCTESQSWCAEGLLCDTSDPDQSLCAAPPGVGQECIGFQCAEGLLCDGSMNPAVCAAAPTLGEACPFGACVTPYVCNDNVCEEPLPQICGVYGGLPLEDCTAEQFTCDDGACIAVAGVCDGMVQCGDGSDEAPFNPDCALGCGVDQYECDDGGCIDILLQCDASPDCFDGSDELPANGSCV